MRAAIVTVMLLSSPVYAGAKQDAAEGARLLKELQEEQAIAVLTRALDRGDATKPEEAELALLLGLARFNLRDEEGARLAFKRGVIADASAELPKLASPKARALFVEVKSAVEDERTKARAEAAVVAVAEPAPQLTEPPKQGDSLTRKVSGVALAVAGVAAAAVGGWAVADAYAQRSAAAKEPDALKAKSLFDTGQSRLTLGSVLCIAGGIVVVGGAAVFFWPSSDSGATVSWVWLGNGLGLRGRF